jgi:ABC-type polysaccharide/polyol phosphate export permease
MLLTISVIYYASESFTFKDLPASSEKRTLFSFLLVGEISLILPMSFAERFLSIFLEMRNLQFYQTLLGLKISPYYYIFSKTVVELLLPLSRMILIIILCAYFMNFPVGLLKIATYVLLQLFAMIIFGLMALIASIIYLKFNRGIGLFYSLQSFAAIIGGVYFPISIFPAGLKAFSLFLPHTQVLFASRLIFGDHNLPMNCLLYFLAVPAILLIVFWALKLGLDQSLKQNGRFF